MHGFYAKHSGEVLLANGGCNWVRIRRGDIIPENALFSGLDWQANKVWIGKWFTGDPRKNYV